MKTFSKLGVALFLLIVLTVQFASAQTCTQTGVPNGCGNPCFNQFDLSYQNTTCPQWVYWNPPYTYHNTSGYLSCGWSAEGPRVSGPTPDWTYIWEDTVAQKPGAGSNFSFLWTVELADAANNSNNIIAVWIEDLDTGSWKFVDQVSGGHWCETRSFNLGSHPEWLGHTLRVQFDTRLVTAVNLTFGVGGFWQGQ
jgi:hypothetical protein